MAQLVARFTRLKKKIGGNRERTGFEFGYGTPIEEQMNITPVNRWNRRILGELEFALRLSRVRGGEFDSAIGQTLTYLEERLEEDSVLTKAACLEAEKFLAPCGPASKEYEVILVAHAHIDMNWMWSWQETVAVTLSTFRTMLNLMKEYPDFKFSQSQTSVYHLVEQHDPEMMEEIRQRIAEGRWEITASAWVETDKNMPNTESLINQIKYTHDYLREHWGIDPASLEIDFSPDTFGHSTNLPEIDTYGGIKYYYLCRGGESDDVLFRWQSPSGKELLVYREQYWYNNSILPQAGVGVVDLSEQCAGLKTGLVVYGVGDHGGGPSRRDVERALDMQEWPVFPKMTFGFMKDFFRKAEAVRDRLPLKKGEQNFVAPGCYTTQSRIKLGNRRCESALHDAEQLNALSAQYYGTIYRSRQFENAWQKVLFTHFHDILPGSNMQDSREYAMGLFQEAMAVANTQYGKAMQAITDRIDTSCIAAEEDPDSQSEGSGTGYGLTYFAGVPNPERGLGKTRVCHVFNPSAHPRREPVEVTLWDWTGDLRDLMAEDMGGRPMALQLLDQTQQFFWDHHYVRVLVDCTVPSCGYTTFVIREGEPQEYRIYYQKDSYRDPAAQPFVLENELIRAEFDYQNGRMVSLRDLQTGEELIAAGKSAGLQCIEAERSSSSAWAIGKYTDFHSELQLISIHPLTSGTLRQSFTAEYKVRNSTVKATVSLDAHARGVRYEWEVDWHEETRTGGQIPVLVYHFPVGYEIQHYLFDVPGGVQARGPLHLDMPGLQFGAAISRQRSSVALISTCKYGYRCADQALNATLIHTAPNPDPYPERGIHKIVEFVAVENRDVKSLCEMAYDCNHSMPTQSGYIHPGDLPASDSLFSFQCKDALVSSVTQTEGGKLLVRFYEINGNQAEAELTFLRKVRTAAAVDLEGAPTGIPVRVEKNRVYVAIPPYALVGMEVSLAEEDAGQ